MKKELLNNQEHLSDINPQGIVKSLCFELGFMAFGEIYSHSRLRIAYGGNRTC